MIRYDPKPVRIPAARREAILAHDVSPDVAALLDHIAHLEENLDGRDLLIYELAMDMGPRAIEQAFPRLAAIAHRHAEVLAERRKRAMAEPPPVLVPIAGASDYRTIHPREAYYDGWIYRPEVSPADAGSSDPALTRRALEERLTLIRPTMPAPDDAYRQRLLAWTEERLRGKMDFPPKIVAFDIFEAGHPQAQFYTCRAVIHYAHYKINPKYPHNKRERSIIVAMAHDGSIGLWPEHQS